MAEPLVVADVGLEEAAQILRAGLAHTLDRPEAVTVSVEPDRETILAHQEIVLRREGVVFLELWGEDCSWYIMHTTPVTPHLQRPFWIPQGKGPPIQQPFLSFALELLALIRTLELEWVSQVRAPHT